MKSIIDPEHLASKAAAHIYLSNRGEQLCLADEEIASQIGKTAAVWRMIKAGRMKIAHEIIEPIAKALDIDAEELFRRVTNEYSPDLMAMIDRMFCASRTTEQERRLIEELRELPPESTSISLNRLPHAWQVVQAT